MKPTVKTITKDGELIIKNISENPFDAEFTFTMYTKKKTLREKLFELFVGSDCKCIISVDRKQSKLISTFIHNELVAADKAYKESKELVKDVTVKSTTESMTSEDKPRKKRTYKPRKKKTATETSTSAE